MRHLFVTLVVLGFAISASTQTIVTGKVTDFSSDEPIAGANVLIKTPQGGYWHMAPPMRRDVFQLTLHRVPTPCRSM